MMFWGQRTLCDICEHLALWDHGSVLMVDLAVALIGLEGYGLEKTAAAECGLKAEPFCLLYNDGNPCICIGK